MDLETEARWFESKRLEWLVEQEGRFAVVQDETVLGFFDSWEEAFRQGVRHLGGARPFLVKEVLAVDRKLFIA